MIKNNLSLLSPSDPVETIQLGDGSGSPLKSVTGPYDATALHTFIRETFPGAILLEEHQVSTSLSPLNVCTCIYLKINLCGPKVVHSRRDSIQCHNNNRPL